MKRIVLALLLPAALLLAGTAHAGPFTSKVGKYLYSVNGSLSVPPEWAGVWTVEDSSFDCNGVFQDVTTYDDTLCTGQLVYYVPPDLPVVVVVDCSGSADATTVNATCTGSAVEPTLGCTMTINFSISGTRNGNTYAVQTQNELLISGANPLCDLLTDYCGRSKTTAVRIAGEPATYCATPALPATWGSVKARYR